MKKTISFRVDENFWNEIEEFRNYQDYSKTAFVKESIRRFIKALRKEERYANTRK